MNSDRWRGYLDRLIPAGELSRLSWKPDDPLVQAEVHRQLMMNLSLGYFCFFGSDTAHPDFAPFLNSVYLLQPNPDDTYCNAFIDGSRGYRISGDRGSVHLLTLTVGAHMMGMTDQRGKMLLELDLDTVTAADGTIDLVLSPERPHSHAGAWQRLPPEAEFVLIRQRSYRWGEERDARLAITPLDWSVGKPRLSVTEIEQRINGMMRFTERLSRQWLNYLNTIRERPVHEVCMTQFDGGVQAQRYWEAIYDIGVDEALILQTAVPASARYWNVQLNDMIWNTVEYLYHQSSLNGAQAAIDSDGMFRAVISATDPGVPNWLDTAGHTTGTVVGRWYECDSHPQPTLRRILLAELRSHLPRDTPVVSAGQREAALIRRVRGGQMRRRW